ncbi:uncharacterized protein BDR25DRAFT_363130 [Lindgomyces ingoldianus]|uniref:Uncharacterized protein n=1 Tax=Lindgomyces ingoldianus TaxID=673940 RepID=A0ACB6Q930_9PLEO|nr:uncharacterized protein BDR25DRAFT_363130 [Lindgomyces ingoldianus]KAF2463045.1 hypothetical protein BDR25DRAFT_363130 [Lindgomyces ingoldianus]
MLYYSEFTCHQYILVLILNPPPSLPSTLSPSPSFFSSLQPSPAYRFTLNAQPIGYCNCGIVARVSRDIIPMYCTIHSLGIAPISSSDLTIHSFNPPCLDLTTLSTRFPYNLSSAHARLAGIENVTLSSRWLGHIACPYNLLCSSAQPHLKQNLCATSASSPVIGCAAGGRQFVGRFRRWVNLNSRPKANFWLICNKISKPLRMALPQEGTYGKRLDKGARSKQADYILYEIGAMPNKHVRHHRVSLC